MRKVKLKYKHYLFDWGDTLMVDFPNEKGPMYLLENVAAVEGAVEVLEKLSKEANCHVATNANDSNKVHIQKALKRVGLNKYIKEIYYPN